MSLDVDDFVGILSSALALSCSEFSDAAVAEATCEFLMENKRKLLASFPNLLPQVYIHCLM